MATHIGLPSVEYFKRKQRKKSTFFLFYQFFGKAILVILALPGLNQYSKKRKKRKVNEREKKQCNKKTSTPLPGLVFGDVSKIFGYQTILAT